LIPATLIALRSPEAEHCLGSSSRSGRSSTWLWRAGDQCGFVLDVLVQRQRDSPVAQRRKRNGVGRAVVILQGLEGQAAGARELPMRGENSSGRGSRRVLARCGDWSRDAIQFHGSSMWSSFAFVRPQTIRSRRSVNHADPECLRASAAISGRVHEMAPWPKVTVDHRVR
jgi:hypothetical protein